VPYSIQIFPSLASLFPTGSANAGQQAGRSATFLKEIPCRIVKNLCESLGVFFDLASEMMSYDSDDDLEKEDIFYE
jgi:hypothetical protein